MDMKDMEDLWHRQAQLGDEPIYCAAYDESEPVLCAGSDEDLDKTARVAKRLRYEEHGLRYLRGQRPSILSASLRGPFDSNSGWKNPWAAAPKQTKMKFAVTKPLPRSAAKPTPVLQKRLERIVAPEAGTPATRDSVQCHLPSPDSHRELDLTDNTHIDAEKRTRIQEWASNVPADTLERDEFWAPGDAAADMSDTSSAAKRPAGSEWLKTKLNKRRRTDPSSFKAHSTPTPANSRAPVQTPRRSNIVPQLHSSRSFEQTTPSSSNAHPNDDSPPRHVENQTEHGVTASKTRLQKSSAAIKPIALKGLSTTTASTIAPTMDSSHGTHGALEPQVNNYAQDPTLQTAPPAEAIRNGDHQIGENETDVGFKSHLDHSFHYKTRPAKRAGVTTGEVTESMNGNISQPTQTGTPESEDRGVSIPMQAEQPQRDTCPSLDEIDQDQARVKDVVPDESLNHPEDSPGRGEVALDQISDAADNQLEGEPEQDGGERSSESESESQHVPSEHACALEATTNQILIQQGGKIMLQDDSISPKKGVDTPMVVEETPSPETTTVQSMILQRQGSTEAETKTFRDEEMDVCPLLPAAFHDEPTLVGDLTDIDGSTLIRMSEAPRRLETIKYPDQAPQALETVKYPDQSPQVATSTELGRDLPQQSLLGKLAGTAVTSLGQSIPAVTDDAANVKDREDVTKDNTLADHISDSGNSVIIIPLSQLEWGVAGPTVDSSRRVREQVEEQVEGPAGDCFIQVEPVDEGEQGAENQPPTNAAQSPWVPDHLPLENQIKTEPADREWTPCSQPISVISSPAKSMGQHPDLRPSQQSPWAPVTDPLKVNAKGISIDMPVSDGFEHSAPEDQQTPWNDGSEQGMTTPVHPGRLVPSDASVLGKSFSTQAGSITFSATEDVANKANHYAASSPVEESCPTASAHFQLTPLQGRDATPEVDLSIKSFAKFNTPSPRRQTGTPRYPGLSGSRFRSTPLLADSTGTNPWSSARSSFRCSDRPRSNLRVSFASLPGEDDEADATGRHPAVAARAASPPPQSSGKAGDEDASVGFHAHFATLRRRSGFTPKFRLQPRLLPSESQQKPMSPAVGAMAEAFREAEVRMSLRSSPEIAVDETETMPENGNDDGVRAQSPWRAESQGADDVAAVLHNLDDFLNPRWDVDAEVEKARSGDGIENQGGNRSSQANTLGASVWDML